MNQHLQTILNFIQQSEHLSDEEKNAILKAAKDANKELEITSFKLDRTEKVKRTTAILLEETIEELEQKRKAVEAQNKELEIEAALERVRAVAMSMKKADAMLDVCKTISQQLELLNVKEIRNVQTAIFYKEKGTYMNYEFYAKHDKTLITETSYTNSAMHLAFASQMLKGKGEFFSTHISKDELPDWIAYQKTTNVFIDTYLETATSVNYYWFSLGPIALGISTYIQLNENNIKLFKRFRNVFELAYRRFLDIEKAEAQAREAKIEAALEKVRSRSLAMHKSDEIKDVVRTVVEKITELNIEMNGGVSLVTFSPESKDLLHWLWIPEQLDDVFKAYLPYFNHIIFKDCDDARKQGLELIGKVYSGEDKQTYFNHLFLQTDFNAGPEEVKAWVMQQPYFGFSFAIQKHSGIFLNDYTGKFFSEETNNILVRFSKVFEQSYIRFLDLQKAEAQTREAQIENALEKVRSRSLAVHKSDEFNEVIKVVFERLQELEIPMTSASINIVINGSKDTESYICGSAENGLTLSHIRLIHFDHPIANDRYDAYRKGSEFFTKTYTEEEKNSFFKYEFEVSDLKHIPADIKKTVMESKRYTISMALTKNSMIVVNDFEGKSLSLQEIDIVKRFARVFEQAYIRFLDLQKAEAQAREAEIELGLERVRARAMAMQASEELNPLIGTVFTELTKLDLLLTRCVILIYEGNEKGVRWWMANSETPSTPMNFFVKYADIPFFNEYLKGWYNRSLKWQYCLEGENKIKTDDFLFTETELSLLPDFVITGMRAPDRVYLNASFNNFGNLTLATLEPLSEEHFNILLRFAKVFDLTYTRFNDLKQAEAQARESQIQLALERVRATSLAMHLSEELEKVVASLFDRLVELGLSFDGAGIYLFDKAKRNIQLWVASRLTKPVRVNLPYDAEIEHNPVNEDLWNTIEKGEDVLNKSYFGNVKNEYYRYVSKYNKTNVSESIQKMMIDAESWTASFAVGKNSMVVMDSWFGRITTEDDFQVLKRFARVFEQAYIRFLDLQKAEAQTRESQIQLALERVRARTMAMQKSDELRQAVLVINEQLQQLNFEWNATNIIIIDKDSGNAEYWVSGFTKDIYPVSYRVPRLDHPNYDALLNPWKWGDQYVVYEYTGEGKISFDKIFFTQTDFKNAPDGAKNAMMSLPSVTLSTAFFSNGALQVIGREALSEEKAIILQRFAKVFEQTYTRFLDLQKAEEQAKEARIETSLERVRAVAMAMKQSGEVINVCEVMYNELLDLGFINIRNAQIAIKNDAAQSYLTSVYSVSETLVLQNAPYKSSPIVEELYNELGKSKDAFFQKEFSGKKFDDWRKWRESLSPLSRENEANATSLCFYLYSIGDGHLGISTYNAITSEQVEILKRFKNVFVLSYQRYKDVAKAEAQAREAQIELAVERVRARTMAMQKSEELKEVIQIVYQQFVHLNIHTEHTGFVMDYKATDDRNIWVASKYGLPSQFTIPYFDSVYYNSFNKAKEKGLDFFATNLSFEEKNIFYKELFKYIPEISEDDKQFYFRCSGLAISTVLLENVGLYIENFEGIPYADEDNAILMRFGKVFQQTYTRFLDLQKAEAQAREAEIEVALEKVRSRSLAMHKSNEIIDVTRVVFEKLNSLGIDVNTAFIIIFKDGSRDSEWWLINKNDQQYASIFVKYADVLILRKLFEAKEDAKELFAGTYHGIEKQELFRYLFTQTDFKYAPAERQKYIFDRDAVSISMAMTNKVAIHVTRHTDKPFSDEENKVINRFTKVFDQSYTRFLDLQKAEALASQAENDLIEIKVARRKAEETLAELQATQKQLIQSEKMASLGELTAGIAHEIQNPLNFVNNFSEVSNELIEELKIKNEELKIEDEEVNDLLNDIKQNLEKINHHGKRADAIVKGMLQHSRQTSGMKEPTNINALADEYLRLSYHGLRAKDKNFNADFKTELDESIGKINIIPQDLGRVLLNLFNNAFYAVNEKTKTADQTYKPLISVQTEKLNDKVEIKVSDNGNGIPASIKEKIFQPFFTTKPTGQGTGLGLSLSYDIIKADGGEIKVESKEGEGSKFVIQLNCG